MLRRNEELTRVLMQLGANARVGIWPHRDATSAYAIAVDREYSEIVATIEREEDNRRARLSHGVTPTRSGGRCAAAGHRRGPRRGGHRLDGSRPGAHRCV